MLSLVSIDTGYATIYCTDSKLGAFTGVHIQHELARNTNLETILRALQCFYFLNSAKTEFIKPCCTAAGRYGWVRLQI